MLLRGCGFASLFLTSEEFLPLGELFLLQSALDLTERFLPFRRLCRCEPTEALLVPLEAGASVLPV